MIVDHQPVYFGEPWKFGTYGGLHFLPVPTPLGKPCLACREDIVDGDRGHLIPTPVGPRPMHRECMVLDLIGSVYGITADTNWGGVGNMRNGGLLLWNKIGSRYDL